MAKRVFLLVILCGFLSSTLIRAEEEKQLVHPKKVEVDTNYDGQIDRIEYMGSEGKIERLELDNSGDGSIDEWIEYADGRPLKSRKDTNGDGKADVWVEY